MSDQSAPETAIAEDITQAAQAEENTESSENSDNAKSPEYIDVDVESKTEFYVDPLKPDDMIKAMMVSADQGDEQAVATRLKYAQEIAAINSLNKNVIDLIKYIAETLDVSIPVRRINTTKGMGLGEIVEYSLKVTEATFLDRHQVEILGIFIHKRIEEHSRQIAAISSKENQLNSNIKELNNQLAQSREKIRTLTQVKKYPTIYMDNFVLAYLNNNGKFVYLATPGYKKPTTVHIENAFKFTSAKSALEHLKSLLNNRNNIIPTAPRLMLYTANLLPVDLEISSHEIEALEKMREDAARYEEVMKAGSKKLKVKKNAKAKKKNKNKNRDREESPKSTTIKKFKISKKLKRGVK